MKNESTENDRILSYKMSYKLTEEDLSSNNVSATGTSCNRCTGVGNANGGSIICSHISNDD